MAEENPKDRVQREKLLQELKQRLREIEELKRELNVGDEEQEREPKQTPGEVREELEELKVPPLDLLEDEPQKKKKKVEQEAVE